MRGSDIMSDAYTSTFMLGRKKRGVEPGGRSRFRIVRRERGENLCSVAFSMSWTRPSKHSHLLALAFPPTFHEFFIVFDLSCSPFVLALFLFPFFVVRPDAASLLDPDDVGTCLESHLGVWRS